MIFSNIKQFFSKNKKVFYYLGFFLAIFLISNDITFAETTPGTSVSEKGWASTITEVGSAILGVLGLLLGLATYLATLFLTPEWINGTLFDLNVKFKEVWILVSNVVYFIFAFILIWIAFMNIIGKDGEQYQLKQALPKFIIGVLIVPFSWFLVQFILSISSILTVAALSLPSETFSQYSDKIDKVSPPSYCTLDLDSFSKSTDKSITSDESDVSSTEGTKKKGWIYCKDETEGSTKNPDTAINSIFKIIALYTYGVLSFDSMDELIENFEGKEVKTVGNLAVQIVFDLLFVVIYAILIIALAMVLLIRGIYIWIYTMISPIFGLMYFFGKKDGAGEGFFAKFNIKEFISLAMVPVYTMLALSFGLLFIYVIGEGLVKNGETTGGLKGTKVTANGNILEIGSFKLEIKGKIGSSTGNDVTSFYSAISEEGGNILGVVGTLILKIFGIIVLWGAVMAAMRSSEITKAIVEPLHQFGTKIGSIASSAPGNIPIFGGQSMKSMGAAASNIGSAIDSRQSKKGLELAQPFLGGSDKDKKYRELATNIAADKFAAHKNVEQIISVGKASDIAASTDAIKGLSHNIQKMIEGGFITDNDDVKNAITQLGNAKGNPQAVKEALAVFDKNSTNDRYSVLGGINRITEAGQVDNHTGNSATKGSSIKPLGSPVELEGGMYKFIGMNIDTENKKIKDSGDYKELAHRFILKGYHGTLTEEEFKNKLDLMKLDSDEQNKIIIEMKRYFEKGKFISTGNGGGEGLFGKEIKK